MMVSIIGGGLTGCLTARVLTDKGYYCVIYEKDKVGGLCQDNEHYQKFTHIFHTDSKKVWDFVKKYATVKPYIHYVKSYSEGKYYSFPANKKSLIIPYSIKMWGKENKQAVKRLTIQPDGRYFPDKYQGIINFRELFKNLTKGIEVRERNVKDGDLLGQIILTGAVDEYFGYCYGKLPYVGMRSTHCKSERRLLTGAIHFPDLDIPFIRMIDYDKFGYEGGYIGIEFPDKKSKHYPVINEKSLRLFKRYAKLAEKKGIILQGRLGTFKCLDMDNIIEEFI